MQHGTRGRLAWVRWGLGLGVGFAGCRFLCAGKYLALLTEHEWGGPQNLAQGGVTFLGILFMTWGAQGSRMVGYLCSCTGCAVTGHLVQ